VTVRFALPLLVGILAGCSTGSSVAAPTVASGAGPAPPSMGITPTCMSAADCLPGEVCCTNVLGGCHSAPCPNAQICKSSVECLGAGFVCQNSGGGFLGECGPPVEDAATVIEGGQGDATAAEATTNDAPPANASAEDTSPGGDATRAAD
jgi:hypothetical protein